MRPWNAASAGSGDARIAKERAGVFLRHSIGTGYSDWGCHCENIGKAIRVVSANER